VLPVQKEPIAPKQKPVAQEKPVTVELRETKEYVIPASDDFQKQKEAFHQKEVKRIYDRTHRYLQESVKSFANELGWKAELEHPINDVRVDAFLTQNDTELAVQVCVTNTPEYEFESIKKILEYTKADAYLLAHYQSKLNKLKKALSEEELDTDRLTLGLVEDFQKFLTTQTHFEPKVQTINGFRVKVNYTEASDAKERLEEIRRQLKK